MGTNENWTDAAQGTKVSILTTKPGTIVANQSLALEQAAAQTRLSISTAQASDVSTLVFQNSTTDEWHVESRASGAALDVVESGVDTRLTVLAGGSVGIGDTSPDAKLDVQTTAAAEVGLIVQGTTSQSGDLAQFNNVGGTSLTVINELGFIGIGDTDPEVELKIVSSGGGGQITLQTTNDDDFASIDFLDDAGTFVAGVGYGNSTVGDPYNDALQFHVQGTRDISFGGAGSPYTSFLFIDNVDGAGDFNVGIGTISPAYRLEVNDGSDGSGEEIIAEFEHFGDSVGDNASIILDPAGSSHAKITAIAPGSNDSDLAFYSAASGVQNAAALYLDGGTNNIGIGVTAPKEKLSLLGSIALTQESGIYFNGYWDFPDNKYYDTDSSFHILRDPDSDVLKVFAATSGTADTAITYTEAINIQDTGAVTINESDADVDFRVESDTDTHALFIDGATGYIGISDATPKESLTIDASATINNGGSLFFNGYYNGGDYYYNSDSAAYIYRDEATDRLQIAVAPPGTADTSATYTTALEVYADATNVGDVALDGDTLYVDSSANFVGIGTDTPGNKLHIYTNTASTRISVEAGTNGAAQFVLINDAQTWNVGLGITDVYRVRDNTGGNDVFTIESGASANSLYINSAGNVGIGDGTPTAGRLVVQGTNTEAVEGSEMITASGDRDFSTGTNWSGTNWTVSGGVATHTAGDNNFTLNNAGVAPDPVGGSTYAITFTHNATTAGGATALRVCIGGACGPWVGSDLPAHTETHVITANNTSALYFDTDATWAGTIDNVSIKEVTVSTPVLALNNDNSTIGLEVRSGGNGLDNVFVGVESGKANTTGWENASLGDFSLDANTTGYQNSALGAYALHSNSTGYENTALGAGALYNNTVGSENTAVGAFALETNTTGDFNTAVGASTLAKNTSGFDNTAIGIYSLQFNTTGWENTGLGVSSLLDNTSGGENTAIGSYSLQRNTTGDANLAVGSSSLYRNFTGSENTAIGPYALYDNETGEGNVALGYTAGGNTGSSGIDQDYNVLIGYRAGFDNRGDYNVLLGYNSGQNNTTGNNNVFLGNQTGETNTTGSNNIIIGNNIDAQAVNSANTLTIGNTIFGTGINATGTTVDANALIGIGDASPDARLDVEMSGDIVAIFNRTSDDGHIIDFQQAGTVEGWISVSGTTITYQGFTGAHLAQTTESIARGELVRYTGDNGNLNNNPESEVVYGVERTTVENDSKVFGAYLSLSEPSKPFSVESNPHQVMSVGNGDMWLVDEGQDIEAGDYLISSSTTGHARLDPRTDTISYVVARAAEDVVWDDITATAPNGKKHVKLSVTFEVFTRDNVTATMQAENIDILNQAFIGTDLLVGNDVTIGNNLNVTGVTTTTNLTVTGTATVANLTVTDSVTITNDLTVSGDTTVADIYVNGHIIAAGDTPTVADGAVLGVSDSASVDGSDTAGTIEVTFGALSTPVAGELAEITFDQAYDEVPRISLTPLNEASLDLPVFIEKTKTGFTITTNAIPAADQTYQYDYIIIQ